VSVRQPFEGQRVRSWITLRSTVSDPARVQRVEYLIDGRPANLIGTVRPDFPKSWQSSTVRDGAHTLVARATLIDGSVRESATRRFTTSNGRSASAQSAAAVQVLYAAGSRRLVVDRSPVTRARLRFATPGSSVTRATLRIYVRDGAGRFVVRAGTASATSKPVRARAWTTVDVTRLVRSGRTRFVLSAAGRTRIVFAGSASRAKPQLLVRP
jgi:Bacterial Ig domain